MCAWAVRQCLCIQLSRVFCVNSVEMSVIIQCHETDDLDSSTISAEFRCQWLNMVVNS